MEKLIIIFFSFLELVEMLIYRNLIFDRKLFSYLKKMTPFFLIIAISHEIFSKNLEFISFIISIGVCIYFFFKVSSINIIDSFVQIVLGASFLVLVQIISLFFVNITTIFIPNTGRYFFSIMNFLVQLLFIGILYKNLWCLTNIRKSLDKNKILAILSISLFLIIIIAKLLNDNGILSGNMGGQLLVLLAMFILTSIILYKAILSQIEKENKLKIENSFKPVLEEYIEKLRAKEHEYKNHLNTIYRIIELEEPYDVKNKLSEYIEKIKGTRDLEAILSIKNTVLKAVLYEKLLECEKRGIKINIDVRSNLNMISIDDTELVIVLSNLLNNAIEAAQDGLDKFINVKIYSVERERKIRNYICIKNSINQNIEFSIGELTKKGYSTKGENRGYGLYNINKILKKTNGKMLVDRQVESMSIEIVI